MSALRLAGVKSVLIAAYSDFYRVWTRFLGAHLIYNVVAFVILTPLAGLVLHLFVSTSGSTVVADQDILFFFLRPMGMLALVVVGAVVLGITALEQACLMSIGYGEYQGTPVGIKEGLFFAARSSKPVFFLAIRIVARVLLLAAPFLIVMGLLYMQLLTEFDINYYLTERPPAFKLALVLAGVLVSALAVLVVRKLLSWSFALPLLLFERLDAPSAMSISAERVRGHRVLVAQVLVGWGIAAFLVSAIPVGLVKLVAKLLVPGVRESMAWLMIIVGLLVCVWVFSSVVVSALNASTFALLVLRLWEAYGSDESAMLQLSDVAKTLDEGDKRKFGLRTIVVGLAAAAVLALAIGFLVTDRLPVGDTVIVTAHRGAALHAPENTIASIARGIEDGADFIEIDVQEDADGRVVVIHDSDLMKIGGSDLKIWDATAAQLQEIDIGSWFSPEFSGERLSTLEEVLELCRGKAKVNIELKYYGHNDRLEERVAEIVESLGMESEIVVMSLKYDMVRKMKSIRPEWTVGLLTATALGDLTKMEADFLAVSTGMAKHRFIRSAHAAGKQVFVWTVNDPLGMSVMMSRGVDSIITDDPGLVRRVMTWREDLNPAERILIGLAYSFGISPRAADVATDVG